MKTIILEGPDLSGKSTISLMLEMITEKEIYHAGGPPTSPGSMLKRIQAMPDDQILDRHPCISEQVYGTVLRGEPIISSECMNGYLFALNPLVIYCRLPLDFLKSKMHFLENAHEDKEYKTKDHIDAVIENYSRIWNSYEVVNNKLISMGICVVDVDFRTETMRGLEKKLSLDKY